jgi:hypothetical protein
VRKRRRSKGWSPVFVGRCDSTAVSACESCLGNEVRSVFRVVSGRSPIHKIFSRQTPTCFVGESLVTLKRGVGAKPSKMLPWESPINNFQAHP